MIKRYTDHAANERTFLAWVRTAIAVMAFGFVIEKFDLFLQVAAPQIALKQIAPHGQKFANAAGLAFIAIGVAMIVLAGIRFTVTAKAMSQMTRCRARANASISRSRRWSGSWAWRCFSTCCTLLCPRRER